MDAEIGRDPAVTEEMKVGPAPASERSALVPAFRSEPAIVKDEGASPKAARRGGPVGKRSQSPVGFRCRKIGAGGRADDHVDRSATGKSATGANAIGNCASLPIRPPSVGEGALGTRKAATTVANPPVV